MNSNRHFSRCFGVGMGAGIFRVAADHQTSNRQWLAGLETVSNTLKTKADDDF
jgi:hypothetical protein